MADISLAQAGRLRKLLDTKYCFDGTIVTLGDWLNSQERIVKTQHDGSCDYNRNTFNRMDASEQRAYEKRLKERRYYCVNDRRVSKTVWDSITER